MATAGRGDSKNQRESNKPWYTDEEFKELIQH